MVLNHGQWRGRQILPPEWAAEALRPHIATDDGLQYGYQWWTGSVNWRGKTLRWSGAFGKGGQRLFVIPEIDLIVVITAGA
jgi:CubicO group peptidase (beta-lactamase class C family)